MMTKEPTATQSAAYTTLMIEAWQAACQDAPIRPSVRVDDGYFTLQVTGNRKDWNAICAAAGVPSAAEMTVDEGLPRLTVRWKSVADDIFGADGLLARALTNYEPRPSQLHMARLVQRSIEMRAPALAEAGTGTGKSFAYLAVALAMGKKVVVAAPTTALQMQLIKKDVPFLLSLEPFQRKRVAYAMGKQRYACRRKVEDPVSGALASPRADFADWYKATESGCLEELPFRLESDELTKVNVDDSCAGKLCAMYGSCFYYQSKAQRAQADVVITNHSLLAMHQLYPGAGILPDGDVLVVDEAHQFPDYVRSALGAEFTVVGIARTLGKVAKLGGDTEMAEDALARFEGEMMTFLADKGKDSSEVGVRSDRAFPAALALQEALRYAANSLWDGSDTPETAEDMLAARVARSTINLAAEVEVFGNPTREGYVRLVRQYDTFMNVPYDVSEFIGELCGVKPPPPLSVYDKTKCARCGRTLTADKVAVLEGRAYGPDCIRMVDVLGDAETILLAEWLEWSGAQNPRPPAALRPVFFTSATLAAPDFDAFKREIGVPHALTMTALSPFDYETNALLFVPDSDAPLPTNGAREEHTRYVIETMRSLVKASRGGAFLLFTSYTAMGYAASMLRAEFMRQGCTVYVQGELPKEELTQRFRRAGNAVLFATKSFWEGVDIQGAALRLVVIDKLPFEAPNPLNQAQEEALRRHAESELGLRGNKLEWYPFEAMRVPKMTTALKQGVGRLIRTRTDYGVMAILDPRLRKTAYGRNKVLPSLPPARLTSDLDEACAFLAQPRDVNFYGGGNG